MVSLAIGEAKESLLEDRILAIPECQSKSKKLAVVADACQAIFSPLIGT